MQREDVDRMDWKAAWYALDADARALLDRAEKAEAERDALQGQLNDLRNGWANSVKAHAAALAERDAAFAAGQEVMRERAAAAISDWDLASMSGINDPEDEITDYVVATLRDLPIKGRVE